MFKTRADHFIASPTPIVLFPKLVHFNFHYSCIWHTLWPMQLYLIMMHLALIVAFRSRCPSPLLQHSPRIVVLYFQMLLFLCTSLIQRSCFFVLWALPQIDPDIWRNQYGHWPFEYKHDVCGTRLHCDWNFII